MKRTVYLPEDLDLRVAEYLQQNPQVTFLGLIQDSLETRLALKDLSPLLKLAGVVTKVKRPIEDDIVSENRP